MKRNVGIGLLLAASLVTIPSITLAENRPESTNLHSTLAQGDVIDITKLHFDIDRTVNDARHERTEFFRLTPRIKVLGDSLPSLPGRF